MIRIVAFIVALVCAVPAIAQPLPANLDKQNAIVIDTTKGRIVIKLRTDLAPKHAEQIKLLTREGFYNNVTFHRVMAGFMASTGRPNSSNSQFFIVFGDASFLDGKYTVIGEVVSGMDVADKLKKAPPGSQSGTVTDPDKMVKVQVASDIK